MVQMEEKLGKPFVSMFDENEMSVKLIRTIIYYGLKENIHDLTEEKAGAILSDALESDEYTFQSVSTIFITELMRSLGMKKNIPSPMVEDHSKNE